VDQQSAAVRDRDAAGYRERGLWLERVDDLLARSAAALPDRLALVDHRDRYRYAQLDAAVSAAARWLHGMGVSAGTAVALVAESTCSCAIVLHALRRLGATCVLLSDHAGSAELASALERTSPLLGVAPARLAASLADLELGISWHSAEERGPDATPEQNDRLCADDPNLVVFTSGSTARPKAVLHSANSLRSAARIYVDCLDLSADDCLFVTSPLSSITGVLQVIEVAPMLGATAVLEERWDDQRSVDLLLAEAATFYGGPDVILRRIFDECARRGVEHLPLRSVALGGTVLDEELLRRAEDEHGIFVARAYGSSEAPMSTTMPRSAPLEDRLHFDGEANADVVVRIGSSRDPSECLLKGPHLFLGYLEGEDDADAFEDGFYRTGDAATMTEGRLKIVGRLKEIIIRNGLNVSLLEVERAAKGLPGIEDAAAYGVTDPATGERLALAVRPSSGASLDLDQVVAGLRAGGLASRSLPEELVVWDEPFPLTPTQKLSRPALAERSDGRPRYVAARLANPSR
jgi:acyl-CoA synthetase (AMP-forming)/AMP-acid ligase II